ncbi:MAG: ATP-grasp domain-containing protein, partial [Terriglobia bacterium]
MRVRLGRRDEGKSENGNRKVKIHEYQAKQILAQHGVAVPRGEAIQQPDEARTVAERLGGPV